MFKTVTIRDGHDNFFTPLRFIFAYMVLIGHAFVVVLGGSSDEPHIFFELTFSYMAVNLFFIASGFLVTGSMMYRKNMASFASARILRIFPALIVHVFIMMFVFGLMTTALPLMNYLTSPDTLKQPFVVLSFLDTEMALPGIVPNNHEHIASATLWTLRYEVLAYIGTFIAFSLGLMKKRWMILAQFLIFVIALPLAYQLGIYEKLPATLQSLLRFGLCYGLGAAIYAYRDKIKLHVLMIPPLVLLTSLFNNTVIFEVVGIITAGYMLFWAAYVIIPKLDFLKKYADISYGVYIYHWATLQGIKHYIPEIQIVPLIVLATPITIVLSMLSLKYVEKPALDYKGKFAQKLSFKKAKPLNV
ncbi:MAG: acyltransferase [Robiginitomaculum sp.]|nr:acyltransferase [Robiginitomaculum sp.]